MQVAKERDVPTTLLGSLSGWKTKCHLSKRRGYIENKSCRSNLRIDGLVELPNGLEETEEICKDFFTTALVLSALSIERVHCAGVQIDDRPGSIVVTFLASKYREVVLAHAKDRWAHGDPDSSSHLSRVHKGLRTKLQQLWADVKLAYLSYDRIHIWHTSSNIAIGFDYSNDNTNFVECGTNGGRSKMHVVGGGDCGACSGWVHSGNISPLQNSSTLSAFARVGNMYFEVPNPSLISTP